MNALARWRQRPAMIGVEIGPEAVRLLQLSPTDAGLEVSHYALEPLPEGTVVERRIADIQAVGKAVARARVRSGTRARHAAVALATSAVTLRMVSVPAGLDETDLEARLELEAARIVPTADSPLHLDFEVLGPAPDAPDRLQVLLGIARTGPVDQYVAALKLGGLRIRVVDVESLALARALEILAGHPLSPEQLLTLSTQSPDLPDIARILAGCTLAQAIPAQDIAHDAPALLLACGLALRAIDA